MDILRLFFLIQSFVASLCERFIKRGRDPTPGINVKERRVSGAGSFMIWDTAGHVEFHVTHAMLLGTNRGIFICVYNCCDKESEQKRQVRKTSLYEFNTHNCVYGQHFFSKIFSLCDL